MAFVQRHVVAVTTDGDGAATAYTSEPVQGRVLGIAYVKTDFADGVDFTITTEATAQQLWREDDVNASKTIYPRLAVHSGLAVALTFDGTEPVAEPAPVANERVKIQIASGGAAKTGTFHVYVGG